MNHYESTFILNPALSEAQVNDLIKKYQSFLKDNGCKIIDEMQLMTWELCNDIFSLCCKFAIFQVDPDPPLFVMVHSFHLK